MLAPTGCLTPDTLVTTDRGLVRLGELGDSRGAQWQDLDLTVATDEGPRQATKFYINGEEPTRRIVTKSGYTIQGTHRHRIKVVDPETGAWVWRQLAEVAPGDVVPLQLGTLVGEPHQVPLPVLDQAYWTGEREVHVPDHVTADLAELVGYYMGDGSLHAKGLRLCVADTDLDVIERLRILGKELFGIEAAVSQRTGYQEVALHSVRLARWWQASGFAKHLPGQDHIGKGWEPHIPSAILETNDREVYAAFLRGVFEADGSNSMSVPSVSTASEGFAGELRMVLLALGIPTTTRVTSSGWGAKPIQQVRIRNLDYAPMFDAVVGFISARKSRACAQVVSVQSGNRDRIFLPQPVWNELVPVGHRRRNPVQVALRRFGGVSRTLATEIFDETADPRLEVALGYAFERVAANQDGGMQPTYDLSVPENVTYVAGGFVSHNTIGLLMDCDTTGIEPDLALVKTKKLVGGGSMSIVNQTVPRALRTLGYADEHVQAIAEYVAENNSVQGAPALRAEHYDVFDCAMGDAPIHYMGHIRMMAAAQPFLSGAISKTVNMPEHVTVEDVEHAYVEGWKLGLKALAIYRDNCKVGQPLSADKKVTTDTGAVIEVDDAPVRRRLPKQRPSQTTSFRVGDIEGYLTAGSYPDDGLGEIFFKVSKQGSTMSGVMDAFAIAISLGLQYGVPLEAYVASRDSCLEVTFGLRVRVTPLKDVDAVLKGVRLSEGASVEATLEDNIVFHNDSELDLGDLRRRARQFGGRFQLKASKSEYLVSNNPGLLEEDDILLSPGSGGDVLLKIYCDYDRKEGRVEVLQTDRPILVRGVPVRNFAPLSDGDTIRIDTGQVLRCNFSERLLEEERNIIRSLEVRDLVCRFRNGQVAIDGISFSMQRGEMVCVMGASGSGKSTLMRALSGQFQPAHGDVLFNGRLLYANRESLRKYVTYIPQHDAFDEHLTIEENLDFAAALRAPHLSGRARLRRIDGKLAELGLNERRNFVVGAAHKKTLSGGERKRLNIGLDMISSADVYLFDEPTSGLSSKDSEHVIEIIRGMSHNKIVLVTIHQPTSKIFQMFHKAVLLDRGASWFFSARLRRC